MMKILLAFVLAAFVCVSVWMGSANAVPNEGDWICMAEPLDSQNTCDVLDHDPDKDTAKKKALALCMDKKEGCGADACQIVRCMKATRRK